MLNKCADANLFTCVTLLYVLLLVFIPEVCWGWTCCWLANSIQHCKCFNGSCQLFLCEPVMLPKPATSPLGAICNMHHTFSFVFNAKLCMAWAVTLVLNAALLPLIASLCVWLLSGHASLVLVGPDSQSSGSGSTASPGICSHNTYRTAQRLTVHITALKGIFLVLIILGTEIRALLYLSRTVLLVFSSTVLCVAVLHAVCHGKSWCMDCVVGWQKAATWFELVFEVCAVIFRGFVWDRRTIGLAHFNRLPCSQACPPRAFM